MKCKVCGMDSGKYYLCRACNIKKEQGLIIKCPQCNTWHYKDDCCTQPLSSASDMHKNDFLYSTKKALISQSERSFYDAIKVNLPSGYCVFPQVNLASFVVKNDDSRFHNELFRNVDFLITDANYCPKINMKNHNM